MKLRAEIDSDGRLRIEVPVDLPAGAADVLVVIQPDAGAPVVGDTGIAPAAGQHSRSGLFLGDAALEDLDVDEARRSMAADWRGKLWPPP